MKKAAIFVSILAVLAVAAFVLLQLEPVTRFVAGLGAQQPVEATPQQAPQAEQSLPADTPVIKTSDQVIVKGRLVPIRSVDLSFNTAGLVAEVLVKEGDIVNEGQVLAHLSNQEQLQASVAAAQLELLNAQQALDTLYRNAPLAAAEALLAVVNAPQTVEDAERTVSNLRTGVVNEADIAVARANLTFAENKLKDAEDAYRPWQNKPENNMTRATLLSRLSQAQKEYDAAKNRLNAMLGTPSESKITRAEADLALARAQQAEAERKYEILKNGPDPDEVALAQARIGNAEAQLAAAQAALGTLEVRAPFTGTVVSLSMQEGQYVAPGVPVLLLVDFSEWKVETTNLTELNVVRIKEGEVARVTFDALPNQPFEGVVERIKNLGENTQGDITYTVILGLSQMSDLLRWNMTCSIIIDSK